MYKLKYNELYASEIANYLNLVYYGSDLIINRPAEFGNIQDNIVCCYNGNIKEEIMKSNNKLLIITNSGNLDCKKDNITLIISENPLKDFCIIVNEFFVQGVSHIIEKSAVIKENAKIGINVHIGRNTFIDDEVSIGNNTYIGSNVILAGKVDLGSNCVIKDGAIIGSEGFAFINDGDEIIHIPQFGAIQIGNDVWVGSNSTIERPIFGNTVIENDVKIDDIVHVGQSAKIGYKSQLTSGTVLANEVQIGRCCFLGINSSVKQNITIGDNVIVGMGSAVVSNLDNNETYVGVPAKQK